MHCPKTGRTYPMVMGCCTAHYDECAGCPLHAQLPFGIKALVNLIELGSKARNKARGAWAWLRDFLGIVLMILAFAAPWILFPTMKPTIVLAAGIETAPAAQVQANDPCHDPNHTCPLLEQGIRQGIAKGKLYTDQAGEVLYNGMNQVFSKIDRYGKTSTTFFPKTNLATGVQDKAAARDYINRQIADAKAKPISAQAAAKLIKDNAAKAAAIGTKIVRGADGVARVVSAVSSKVKLPPVLVVPQCVLDSLTDSYACQPPNNQ